MAIRPPNRFAGNVPPRPASPGLVHPKPAVTPATPVASVAPVAPATYVSVPIATLQAIHDTLSALLKSQK